MEDRVEEPPMEQAITKHAEEMVEERQKQRSTTLERELKNLELKVQFC